MKPRLLLIVPVALLAGCAILLPQEPSVADRLRAAYATIKQAMAANADEFAAADMRDARQRYDQAYALMNDDPDRARQLADESQVVGTLALTRAQAALAAQQRSAAKNEVETLEQLALPRGVRR
jgi:hypothetical protein